MINNAQKVMDKGVHFFGDHLKKEMNGMNKHEDVKSFDNWYKRRGLANRPTLSVICHRKMNVLYHCYKCTWFHSHIQRDYTETCP